MRLHRLLHDTGRYILRQVSRRRMLFQWFPTLSAKVCFLLIHRSAMTAFFHFRASPFIKTTFSGGLCHILAYASFQYNEKRPRGIIQQYGKTTPEGDQPVIAAALAETNLSAKKIGFCRSLYELPHAGKSSSRSRAAKIVSCESRVTAAAVKFLRRGPFSILPQTSTKLCDPAKTLCRIQCLLEILGIFDSRDMHLETNG